MKRMAMGLIAAVIGLGAFESIAEAQRSDRGRKPRVEQARKGKKAKAAPVGQRRAKATRHRTAQRARPWDRRRAASQAQRRKARARSRRHVAANQRRSAARTQRRQAQARSRWHSHPTYRALTRSNRILLNNRYTGGGYVAANRWYDASALRFLGLNPDGSYRIWFNGTVYRGYSRIDAGRRILYLGTAPTAPGYRFELILH
jgi:hypothetical protein